MLKTAKGQARVEPPRTVHAMEADVHKAAQRVDRVAAFLASECATE